MAEKRQTLAWPLSFMRLESPPASSVMELHEDMQDDMGGKNFKSFMDLDDTSVARSWRTGIWRRFPWLGIGSLLLALFSLAASVMILVITEATPVVPDAPGSIFKWRLQPTVYLAITSTATSILIHFALSEAVKIAWWRRATHSNTRIEDLHRYWQYHNSLWAALTSGVHVNSIAVACVLVTLTPVITPLYQRASQTQIKTFSRGTNIDISVAQVLPDGYTGFLSGRSYVPSLMSTNFTRVVDQTNMQAPIQVSSSGCFGKCEGSVQGQGFAINCSSSTQPYMLSQEDMRNLSDSSTSSSINETGESIIMNGTDVFESTIGWRYSSPYTMNLGFAYKNDSVCDGKLQITNCTLRAAVVKYPIVLDGNSSTVQLRPGSSMSSDKIVKMTGPDGSSSEAADAGTTFGGLYKAISDIYTSTAHLRYAGAIGYELSTTGATSNRYVLQNPGSSGQCSMTFADPTHDIVGAIRDMTFRTAVAAADDANTQTILATQTYTTTVYFTDWIYLGVATLIAALGWLATLPIFFGWWNVGRSISMSPIEIAKAFRAPMLESSDSNADSRTLLREVGNRPVKYGAVASSGSDFDTLEMSNPDRVVVPRAGQSFGG